jgi:hypothetical protein
VIGPILAFGKNRKLGRQFVFFSSGQSKGIRIQSIDIGSFGSLQQSLSLKDVFARSRPPRRIVRQEARHSTSGSRRRLRQTKKMLQKIQGRIAL